MASYIAYLRKDMDSDYGSNFHDLPGCFSAGATLEEAKAMAAEALAGHVAVLEEEGLPVPPPSSVDDPCRRPSPNRCHLFLVDLEPSLLKPERVNIMIPATCWAESMRSRAPADVRVFSSKPPRSVWAK
jgi:predicted RNase H-like HicB family nuclease